MSKRTVRIVLLLAAACLLHACESDPVTVGDATSSTAIKPLAAAPDHPQTFSGRFPYKP